MFDSRRGRGHIFQLGDRVTSQTSFPMMRFPVDENALGLERIYQITKLNGTVKPIFHLATLFAWHKAKTKIPQRDWLKLVSEKIRRQQVGTVPTFLFTQTESPSRK